MENWRLDLIKKCEEVIDVGIDPVEFNSTFLYSMLERLKNNRPISSKQINAINKIYLTFS